MSLNKTDLSNIGASMNRLNSSILLHANMLYAEIPFSKLPTIVNNSYGPVLEAILGIPGARVVLNFSGYSLEVLNGEHPEIYEGNNHVIELLKEGLQNHQIELSGTSYSHTVLPMMPLSLIEEDLKLHLDTTQRILGYEPKGFFPPEMGISPILPGLLKELGYEWSFVIKDFLSLSRGNHFNAYNDFEPIPPSFAKETAKIKFKCALSQVKHLLKVWNHLRKDTDFYPILWQGAENQEIPALGGDTRWIMLSLLCMSHTFPMDVKKLLRTLKMNAKNYRGYFMPYASDIEFYGFGGNTIKEPIPVSRLEALIRFLSENPEFNMILPSDYLNECSEPKQSYYLKAGTWSTDQDFQLWEQDPGNQALNRITKEAYELFEQKKDSLNEDSQKRLLRNLVLAYNSDGRGWTSLPEHSLFCFDQAMKVIRELRK